MKKSYLKVIAPLTFMFYAVAANASDQVSFSIGPAPANLASNKSVFSLGVNMVNVDIENADSMTATTYSANFKTHMSDTMSKKSYIYLSQIDSPAIDSGAGFGLGVYFTKGVANGMAGIFGLKMDVIDLYTTIFNDEILSEIVTYSGDLGVQYHYIVNEDVTWIPWAKMSAVSGTAEVSGGALSSDPVDFNYTSTGFGMDVKYRDISLGAMVQQGEKSTTSSFSFGYDF